jgi:hypothetical protein
MEEAMMMLSSAKQLQEEWIALLGNREYKLKDYAFKCLIVELKNIFRIGYNLYFQGFIANRFIFRIFVTDRDTKKLSNSKMRCQVY